MNRIILLIGLLLISAIIYAQEKSILDGAEVFLSVNRTTLLDENSENRNGFGAGVNFLFNSDKSFSLLTGIEYNHTRQYKYELFEGRWCTSSDWDISMHLFSIPIGLRYRFGSKKRLLVESGIFGDISYKSTREGEKCCYSPDSLNNMVGGCNQVIESGVISPGLGVYFGVGYRIPILKVNLIVKPDYKFGFKNLYSYSDAIYNRYIRLNIILKFN